MMQNHATTTMMKMNSPRSINDVDLAVSEFHNAKILVISGGAAKIPAANVRHCLDPEHSNV